MDDGNLKREKDVSDANYKWTELATFRKEEQIIFYAWNSFPESCDQLKMIAFGILTISGLTDIREQKLSNMIFIKEKFKKLTE